MKKLGIIVAVLSLVLVLSACSSMSADWEAPKIATTDEAQYNRVEEAVLNENEPATGGGGNVTVPERKVIFTYDFTVEADDIDTAAKTLENAIAKSDGFVSSLKFGGRNDDGKYKDATIVYRIPADKVGSFKEVVESVGAVVSKSEEGEDVTESYFDTEGRLSTLKIQEARLLELLSKSGNLSDLLTIERELADVRGQIESLTGTLKKYDNLVSLATFTVKFQLPKQNIAESGTSFGGAFADSFSIALDFLNGIVIVFIYLLPYLLAIGIILTVIILIIKKKRKNK